MSIEAYIIVTVAVGGALLITRIFAFIFPLHDASKEKYEWKVVIDNYEARDEIYRELKAAHDEVVRQRMAHHQTMNELMQMRLRAQVTRQMPPNPLFKAPVQTRAQAVSCAGCGAQVLTEQCEYCGRYR